MVVQTRDPLAPYDGLALDAEGAIPEQDETLAVPDGDDESDPSVTEGADEAATETAPEDDETAALREQLRAELSDSLTAQLNADFEKRLQGYQRTMDTKVHQKDRDIQRLRAEADFRENWMRDYMQKAEAGEVQPNSLHFDRFKNQLREAVDRVDLNDQQIQQAHQQWRQEWAAPSMQRMLQFRQQQAADTDGTALFDINHPDLVKAGEEVYKWADIAKHAELRGDTQTNMHAAQMNNDAFTRHERLVMKMREDAIRNGTAAKRQKVARDTQAVRQKQSERGVQNTARGGTGAAPSTFDKHMEQAQRENPDASFQERYLRAMELEQAGRAPTRR